MGSGEGNYHCKKCKISLSENRRELDGCRGGRIITFRRSREGEKNPTSGKCL